MRKGARDRARRMGIVAVLVTVLLGFVQFGWAGAETVEENAVVSREAYFTYPITQTTPRLLRNGFPPATACLAAGLVGVPQICGNEAQQVAALLGLTDGIPIPITPDSDLAQPVVLPGTTPVGMFGGQPRYVSLLALNIPTLSTGQRFGSLELVLHEDGFNFALESPALRDVVLQLVAQLEEQDPAKISDAITRALTGEVPFAAQTVTGIDACPITEPWNAGRGQSASLDGTRLPGVDCLTGTTGKFDEGTRTWTFDLTFAAQAWTEGVDDEVLPNQGVMLGPVGAPNFAYGDPDFSTNWVVSLADSTTTDPALRPRIRYTTVSDETGAVVDPGGFVDLPASFVDDSGLDSGLSGGSPSGGGTVGRVVPVPKPRVIASSSGSTPGWLWFLLPLALIATFLFDQSLIATPAALRRRPGALTHLELRRDED